MLQGVDVGELSLDAYRGIAPDSTLDELREQAERLRGARVLHINATSYGGGVSELLRSTVPLLNDLGLVVHWEVISGDERFFDATKTLHNALQGAERGLSDEQRDAYLASARQNATALAGESYDFVFVHDPQPAALLSLHGKGDARWIWRCHIDTSAPNPDAWAFLRDFLAEYDAAIFTMEDFVPPEVPLTQIQVIPPAIDPLSPKNLTLPDEIARQVLEWIGVEMSQPLVAQVSRFDPWKDPLGVISAFRLAREECPELQLALAGSMALDDPEGWGIYETIAAESQEDPAIHVLTNLTGVGNIEVNALQRLSKVVVQKSIREGFGLVVSEAMWKGTPVVAGRAGGIPLQMADGVGGVLVDSVDECAEAIIRLLRDPDLAGSLGKSGRARARDHFLLPRLLLNEISLMSELAEQRPLRPLDGGPDVRRDPVCGMALELGSSALEERYDGTSFFLCSERCRARFRRDPERYARALRRGSSFG